MRRQRSRDTYMLMQSCVMYHYGHGGEAELDEPRWSGNAKAAKQGHVLLSGQSRCHVWNGHGVKQSC